MLKKISSEKYLIETYRNPFLIKFLLEPLIEKISTDEVRVHLQLQNIETRLSKVVDNNIMVDFADADRGPIVFTVGGICILFHSDDHKMQLLDIISGTEFVDRISHAIVTFLYDATGCDLPEIFAAPT